MYSKKTLTLLAVLVGVALVASYWKEIQAWAKKKFPGLGLASGGTNTTTGETANNSGNTGTGGTTTPLPTPLPSGTTGDNQKQVEAWNRYKALPGAKPSAGETLKMGSKSKAVFVLQGLMNMMGQNLTLDGIFGEKTETALYVVFGKRTTTLNEFIRAKVPANSPLRVPLKAYGLA